MQFSAPPVFGFGASQTQQQQQHQAGQPVTPFGFTGAVQIGKPLFDMSATAGSTLFSERAPFGKHDAGQQQPQARDDAKHEPHRRFLEPPPQLGGPGGGARSDAFKHSAGVRHRGTFLGLSKGGTANFGFIKPEAEGQNVFVHGSNLAEDLQAGQTVDYELAPHEQVRGRLYLDAWFVCIAAAS